MSLGGSVKKVNKKQLIISASCLMFCLTTGSYLWMRSGEETTTYTHQAPKENLSDEALLALIKNDKTTFTKFIKSGGDVHAELPAIDGKTYTVAEGLAYFERVEFIKYLQENKISFFKQSSDGSDDMLTLAVKKNNPELFKVLLKEKPDFTHTYGKQKQNLLHVASSQCAHELTDLLHQNGKFDVHEKQKNGASAMTLAASGNCLPMLSYWKEQKEDFAKKDGRGKDALSVLKKNKDAAANAFVASFTPVAKPVARKPASVKPIKIPDFYKKRKIPKDQLADHSALIEPEIRPLDADETAEYSEFAD